MFMGRQFFLFLGSAHGPHAAGGGTAAEEEVAHRGNRECRWWFLQGLYEAVWPCSGLETGDDQCMNGSG